LKIPPTKRPTGYSPEARRLWDQVVSGWALDAPALPILDQVCRALMRIRQAQATLAGDGITIQDRFSVIKAHPCVAIERDAQSTFLRAIKALNLDLEPLQAGVGRPPKRHGG